MLRRVARVSRLGLAIAGACLLLWLPASYLFFASLKLPLPENQYVFAHTTWGRFRFVAVETGSMVAEPSNLISYGVTDFEAEPQRPALGYGGFSGPGLGSVVWLHIPIAPMAVLLLAWPVTSFIVARRRRRLRGFEVEAKAADSTPLPPGEVDAERSGADGEGGRQPAPERHRRIN